MIFKFSRLASVVIPSMLVFGVYADTLQTLPGSTPSKYDTNTTSSAQISGAQLGLTGPLEVGLAYSDLYGAMATAQYTLPITENQAFSLLLEGGGQQYRVNATYGIQVADKHRFKATIERLAQDMEFTFTTGNQNQWVGQNAIGLAYQYVIQSNWLNAFNVSGYYANAESSDLSSVNYMSSSSDCSTVNAGGSINCVNNRSIAGASTFGFEAGFEASPWDWSNVGFALNYDDVDYNAKYAGNSFDENGFGFTATGEQLITPTLKATGLVSMRQTWNEYNAGLAWLIPTKVGHRLELGANVGYTAGKTTGNNNLIGAVGLTYRWDGPRAKPAVYSLAESGKQEFIDWVSTPAVYMEEVLAIADEQNVQGTAKTTGNGLGNVALKENEAIVPGSTPNTNWGAGFISPAGVPLTYSSNNLPNGFSIDPNTGVLSGTAHACPPLAPVGQPCATYSVNVTAKTPYEIQEGAPGFTQPGIITIEPVSSGSIDLSGSTDTMDQVVETTTTNYDASSLFTWSVTPGLEAKKGAKGKKPEMPIVYKYNEGASNTAGLDKVTVDSQTGAVVMTAATVAQETKGSIVITGDLRGPNGKSLSTADATLHYTVQPTAITGENTDLGKVTIGEQVSYNLDTYFQNTCPITGTTYELVDANGSGLTVSGNTLSGTLTEPGQYTVKVAGASQCDKNATADLKITAEKAVAPTQIDIKADTGTLPEVIEGANSQIDAASLFTVSVLNPEERVKAQKRSVAAAKGGKARQSSSNEVTITNAYSYAGPTPFPAGISNIAVNPTTGAVQVTTETVSSDTAEAGQFKVKLTATASDGVVATADAPINYSIQPSTVTGQNTSLGTVTAGQNFNANIAGYFTTNAPDGVIKDHIITGSELSSLSLSGADNSVLSGVIPAGTAAGTYSVNVDGVNTHDRTGTAIFTITVEAAPAVIDIQAEPGALPAVIEGENNVIDASKLFSWTVDGEAALKGKAKRQAKQSQSESNVTATYSLVDSSMPAGIASINVHPTTGIVNVKTEQVSATETGKFTVRLTLTSGSVTETKDTTIDYTVNPSVVTPTDYTHSSALPPGMPVTMGGIDGYFTTNAQGGMKSFEVADPSTGFKIISGNILQGTIPSDATPGSNFVVPVTGYNQYGKLAVANFTFPIQEALKVLEINGGVPNVAGTAGIRSEEFVTAGNYFQSTPAGAKITYSISGLPSYGDYTFDPATGKLSGMPKCSSLSNCNYRMASSNPADWAYSYNLVVTAKAEYAGKVETATSNFKLCVAVDTGDRYQQAAQDCKNSG